MRSVRPSRLLRNGRRVDVVVIAVSGDDVVGFCVDSVVEDSVLVVVSIEVVGIAVEDVGELVVVILIVVVDDVDSSIECRAIMSETLCSNSAMLEAFAAKIPFLSVSGPTLARDVVVSVTAAVCCVGNSEDDCVVDVVELLKAVSVGVVELSR